MCKKLLPIETGARAKYVEELINIFNDDRKREKKERKFEI